MAALRGSLGLDVQLSCETDVSILHCVGRALCLGSIKVNIIIITYLHSLTDAILDLLYCM